jgi:hypothetical protein
MILTPFGRREAAPIPADVRDEIILWYRGQGRQATVVWDDTLACAEVRVRFLPGDPRLKGFQEGQYPYDFESFWLHRDVPGKGMVGYNLAELGASGVRNLLDESNLWSGRGKHRSLQESINAVHAANEARQEAIKRAAADNARMRAMDRRARILEVPRTTAQRPARLAHAKE